MAGGLPDFLVHLSNAAAAEDAAQSACEHALNALPTLRRSDRFAPWFYRIVANEAKRLRRTARELPGMSSAEIGRILATSPVTARWRLMLAHRKLRAILEPSAAPDLRIAGEPCR